MKRIAGMLVFGFGFALAAAAVVYFVSAGPATLQASASTAQADNQKWDYRVLATNKTSTMEKELNQAAAEGFRFEAAMGGETSFGGNETVAIMSRPSGSGNEARFEYKLLATSRTSTMQKELTEAGNAGFVYRDQTVFKTTFGGKEVVSILERDREAAKQQYEYKLLATSKTSTMEKELKQAGDAGYQLLGITVAETLMGGSELVSIMRRISAK
jgi:hypothetical protein